MICIYDEASLLDACINHRMQRYPSRPSQPQNAYGVSVVIPRPTDGSPKPEQSQTGSCCVPLSNATITILNRIAFCMHFVMFIVAIVGRYVHVSEFLPSLIM
jgi:hypothetical protein